MARVRGIPSVLSLAALTVGALEVTGAATFAETVTATGQFLAGNGSAAAPSYSFAAATGNGMYADAIRVFLAAGGLAGLYTYGSVGVVVVGTLAFSTNEDVILVRDAANVLAQRNGTNAQEFRVYGTTTGSKYLRLLHNGTNATVESPASGNLYLRASSDVSFGPSSGSFAWTVDGPTGILYPAATGTHGLGLDAYRISVAYLGGNAPAASAPMIDCAQTWNDAGVTFVGLKMVITDTASAAGALPIQVLGGAAGTTVLLTLDKNGTLNPRRIQADGYIAAGDGSALGWGGRGYFSAPSDGVFTMTNNAGNNFTRLCFGGTTNAFPALKRSGGDLVVRLADDSGYANLYAGAVVTSDAFYRSGVQVVGAQGAAVADATGAGDVVAQLNTLLARLRAHGLIAT